MPVNPLRPNLSKEKVLKSLGNNTNGHSTKTLTVLFVVTRIKKVILLKRGRVKRGFVYGLSGLFVNTLVTEYLK